MRQTAQFAAAFLLSTASARAQTTVCDLFQDLRASDERQLRISGELVFYDDVTVLTSSVCDKEYRAPIVTGGHIFRSWSAAFQVRASNSIPENQAKQLRDAAAEIARLRDAGKFVMATATLGGRLKVTSTDSFPAEFAFDSIEALKVEILPDPSELPVIPICDLFQDLESWKGKRIAVRGEFVSTGEGAWISGRCKGSFFTNGYRWPVILTFNGNAYSSNFPASTAGLGLTREERQGSVQQVIRTAIFVGRLLLRDKYVAMCGKWGEYVTNGFGHLNGATGALIVEAVRDLEVTPRQPPETNQGYEKQTCQPPNQSSPGK